MSVLIWTDVPTGSFADRPATAGSELFTRYSITHLGSSKTPAYWLFSNEHQMGSHPSLDAAKAAAERAVVSVGDLKPFQGLS